MLADRYALEEKLGRGGTGMVLRAQDRLLGRAVTITLIHPSLGDDPAFAARLAEESRNVASLSGLGFLRLLDTGEEQGVLFLVREHVDGSSARELLERQGLLSPRDAVRIAAGVLEALEIAHEARLLHLGLDIDDVLIGLEGDVVVSNLGIGAAVAATRPPSEVARIFGDGLAPEQTTGGVVDERTDVFAVGALLFELLTGHPPAGRTSPREVRADVPRSLDRAVARALAPEPSARFPTARAFATALAGLARKSGAGREAVEEDSRPGWLRTWLAAPLAIALVAAAVISFGLWFGRLEVGGPLGIRPADAPPTSPAPTTSESVIAPSSVVAFDPFGDGQENDSNLALAIDGDRSTAWRSENYFDGSLRKPGVGLVFDLGASHAVTGFRLSAPNPGYVFHVAVGEEPDALVDATGESYVAGRETRGTLEGSGRYVLVWITTVVPAGDGIRAEVAEFRVVVGPA
jgi:eukaryotic-like serine/threonine-protein kinase